jgi:hypothetical protein
LYDPGTLYTDPILTNFSVGFQDQNLYGERIFPVTRVNTQSGRYRVFDRSDWLIFPSRREPGTIANEVVGRKWSEDTFKTQEHSLQSPIYDEERQQLESQGGLAKDVFGGALQINPEADATKLITRSILLEHEKKVADTVRNTANYAANHKLTLVGAAKWSDYTGGVSSTSDPVANLRVAVQRIYLDTGRYPTHMIIPWDAVGIIDNHPRVVDRFKAFTLNAPNAWQVILGLPEATPITVFVVDSKINTANNVDATEVIASLWGQDVWLGVVDPTEGQNTMTFGKTFAQIYPDGSIRPTDRWREEPRKADLVRTSMKYDLKIVSALAGYLFTDAVAAIT